MTQVVAVMTSGDGTPESIVQAEDSLQVTDQWYAARAAAEDDTLGQIKASKVKCGMTLWCPDSQSWFVAAADAVTANIPLGRIDQASEAVTSIKIATKRDEDSRTWSANADHDLIRRFPRHPPVHLHTRRSASWKRAASTEP